MLQGGPRQSPHLHEDPGGPRTPTLSTLHLQGIPSIGETFACHTELANDAHFVIKLEPPGHCPLPGRGASLSCWRLEQCLARSHRPLRDDLCPAGLTHLRPLASGTAQQTLNRRDEWAGTEEGQDSGLCISVPPGPWKALEHSRRAAWRLNGPALVPVESRSCPGTDKGARASHGPTRQDLPGRLGRPFLAAPRGPASSDPHEALLETVGSRRSWLPLAQGGRGQICRSALFKLLNGRQRLGREACSDCQAALLPPGKAAPHFLSHWPWPPTDPGPPDAPTWGCSEGKRDKDPRAPHMPS